MHQVHQGIILNWENVLNFAQMVLVRLEASVVICFQLFNLPQGIECINTAMTLLQSMDFYYFQQNTSLLLLQIHNFLLFFLSEW